MSTRVSKTCKYIAYSEVLKVHRVRSLSVDHPHCCRTTVARSRTSSRRLRGNARAKPNDVIFESGCRPRLFRGFAGGVRLTLLSSTLPHCLLSPSLSSPLLTALNCSVVRRHNSPSWWLFVMKIHDRQRRSLTRRFSICCRHVGSRRIKRRAAFHIY